MKRGGNKTLIDAAHIPVVHGFRRRVAIVANALIDSPNFKKAPRFSGDCNAQRHNALQNSKRYATPCSP